MDVPKVPPTTDFGVSLPNSTILSQSYGVGWEVLKPYSSSFIVAIAFYGTCSTSSWKMNVALSVLHSIKIYKDVETATSGKWRPLSRLNGLFCSAMLGEARSITILFIGFFK